MRPDGLHVDSHRDCISAPGLRHVLCSSWGDDNLGEATEGHTVLRGKRDVVALRCVEGSQTTGALRGTQGYYALPALRGARPHTHAACAGAHSEECPRKGRPACHRHMTGDYMAGHSWCLQTAVVVSSRAVPQPANNLITCQQHSVLAVVAPVSAVRGSAPLGTDMHAAARLVCITPVQVLLWTQTLCWPCSSMCGSSGRVLRCRPAHWKHTLRTSLRHCRRVASACLW